MRPPRASSSSERSTPPSCRLLGMLLAGALLALPVAAPRAQDDSQENVGFSPNHAYAAGAFGETVDVTTGNLTLQVPIGPTYQVNDLSYGIVLTYNSKIWDYRYPTSPTEEQRRPYLKNRWTYGAGWTFHAGRIYIHPRANYELPQKIMYEAPDGATHALYPEDDPVTATSWYYSKDSSYLRARAYTVHKNNLTTQPQMRIWKLWEPDGTARVLGYLLGYGRPPNYFTGAPLPDEPYITVPFPYPEEGATGWYTIRVESPRQRNLDNPGTGACLSDEDLYLEGNPVGVTSPVSGNPREVPCSWVEYFYVGSLPSGVTSPVGHHSLPTQSATSGVHVAGLLHITDSAGRQIDVRYNAAAAPDGIAFFLPGLGGTQVRYGLGFQGPHRLNSPLAPELLYQPSGGSCVATPGPMPATAAIAETLSRVTYPEGLVMDFDYFHPDCASHGMVTARVLPTGGRSTYEYKRYSLNDGGDLSLSVTKKTFEVTGQAPAVWEYSRDPTFQQFYGVPPDYSSVHFSNPPKVYEVDPDGNMTVYHLYTNMKNPVNGSAYPAYGLPWKIERMRGRSLGAAVVARQVFDFDFDFDDPWYQDPFDQYPYPQSSNSQPSNLRRVMVEDTIFQSDGTELVKRTDSTDFDPFGRAQRVEERVPGSIGTDAPILRTSETPSLLATGTPGNPDLGLATSCPADTFSASALTTVLRERWILDTTTSSNLLRSGTGPAIRRSWTECFDALGYPVRNRALPNPAVTGEYVQTATTRDAYGNVIEEVVTSVGGLADGIARTVQYERDDAGHLLRKKQGPDDTFDWYSFDRGVDLMTGLVTSSRTPAGIQTSYVYDTLRRLRTITPGGGEAPTQITYPTARHTVETQGSGLSQIQSEYFYDQAGRLTQELRQAPASAIQTRLLSYDSMGRKTFESEWAGGTPALAGTSYEYTIPILGPAQPVPPGTAPENIAIDPLGRVTRVIAADGATTETSYSGLVTTIRTSDLNRVPGNTQTVPGLPHEAVSVYTNDAFGRLLEVDAPDGDDASYTYDEQDHLIRVEMGAQVREFVYDGLGRLLSSNNPENGLVQFQGYDPAGQLLKKTDAAGVITWLEYDAAGRLLKEYRQVGAVARVLKEFTYDTASGTCTNCTGRLTSVCYEDEIKSDGEIGSTPEVCTPTVRRELSYGGLNGRLSEERLILEGFPGDPLVTQYEYTNLGQLDQVTYPERDPAGHLPTVVTYEYQRGFLQRVGDDTDVDRFITDVSYNPAGGKRLVRYGNGTWSDFTPDIQNRPHKIRVLTQDPSASLEPDENSGVPLAAEATFPRMSPWDDWLRQHPTASREKRSLGPGQIASLPRDLLALAQSIEIDPGDPGGGGGGSAPDPTLVSWDSGDYFYDGAGNIIAIGQDAFQYDALSRLVKSTMRNLPGPPTSDTITEEFTYDGAGNMLERTKAVGTGNVITYTFGVQSQTNRLQSLLVDYPDPSPPTDEPWEDFAHDAVGNLLRDDQNEYLWDPQGRLREVRTRPGRPEAGTVRGRYSYDDRGYRYRKVEDGIESFYVRDLEGRVLSEFRRAADTNVFPVWDQDYIYALGGAIALIKNDTPQPPSRFRMVSEMPNDQTMRLQWTKSDETDIEGYRVWRKQVDISGPFEPLFPAGGVTVEHDTAPDPVLYGDPSLPGSEYEYFVRAVDTAGNESMDSRHLTVDFFASDTFVATWGTPPMTPGDGTLQLHWSVPAEDAPHVVGYNVYCKGCAEPAGEFLLRNVNELLETPGYLDVGLVNGTAYEYKVTVVNTYAGETGFNLAVSAFGTPEDTIPPSPPPGVRGQPGPDEEEVTLFWGASTAADVAGYRVYEVGGTTPLLSIPVDPESDESFHEVIPTPTVQVYHLVVRAYDDDGNESANSTVVDVGPWGGGPGVTINDNWHGAPTNPLHSYDYGYARDEEPEVYLAINGPQPQFFEGVIPGRPQYGQPVIFRAAHLVITFNTEPDPPCPGVHIYRQGATPEDWQRLTVQPIVGDDDFDCAVSYFDTTATGMSATYRVSVVNPSGLESVSSPVDYVYSSTDAPWKVMGQYAFGANLVTDDPLNLDGRIAIPEGGGWELGSLPSKHPVVLRWRKPPNPEVLGYRIWAWDRRSGPSSDWVPVKIITTADTTEYFDDKALYGWPLVKIGGLWDLDACIAYDPADVSIVPAVPCRTGAQWDNLTLYFVEGLTDLEAAAPADPPVGTGDIWRDAVRAIRLNAEGPCPESEAFCDNCPGTCDWPDYAPAEDLLRANFTSPIGESYPGYEDVTHETAFPTFCGLEGTIPCGWLDTTGLEGDGYWGVDPDDERFSWWVGYAARGAGSRTFRMVVEPGEYFVEIGTSPWTLGSLAVISVNGVWYWNEEYLALPVTEEEIDDARIVKRLLVTTTPEGYLDISIGGAPGSSPLKTQLSYVRVQASEYWGGGGGAFLMNPEGAEPQYLIASATYGTAETPTARVASSELASNETAGNIGAPQTLGWLEARVRRGAVLVGVEDPAATVAALAPDRLVGQMTPSVTVQWLHVDHLGSTRMVTDETGIEVSRHKFLPFGQEIDTSDPMAPNTHKFTGHERGEESGLDYMMARYYAPMYSRFMNPDPGDDIELELPESWNLHSYVRNRSIVATDPNGEDTFINHDSLGYSPRATSKYWPPHHDILFTTRPPKSEEEARAHPNGVVEVATDWHSDTSPQTSKNEERAVKSAQKALDEGKAERIAGEEFDKYVERAVDARRAKEQAKGFKPKRWSLFKTSRAHTRDVLRDARAQWRRDCRPRPPKPPPPIGPLDLMW